MAFDSGGWANSSCGRMLLTIDEHPVTGAKRERGDPLAEQATAIPSLPRHIQVWIAKTLAMGYGAESVYRKLIDLGYEERAAASKIAEVTSSPGFAAAVELAKSRDKLALLLD